AGGMGGAAGRAGTIGHFGAELKRFVIAQYVQGQVTVPRLVSLLNDIGIVISKRQVMRLLIEGQDAFLSEARDVLHTGLSTAAWITVITSPHMSVQPQCSREERAKMIELALGARMTMTAAVIHEPTGQKVREIENRPIAVPFRRIAPAPLTPN